MKKYIQWYTAAITALVICTVNCSNIMAENNMDIKEKAYSSEHITEEYEGDDGNLCIDADLNIPSETIYTGTLTFSDISFEQGKKLYGDSEKWVSSDFLKDGESMEYGDTGVFLMRNPESHVFYLENIKKEAEISKSEMLTEPEALCMAEDAVNILGINAEVVGRFAGETDPEGIYSYILGGTIHALPVASMSDIYSNGSVEITGSQYSYVGYSRHYTPEEQTEAELLDFAEILEKVEIYTKAGFIRLPQNGSPVSEISLEYYVENTVDGMIFYPVWNFRVSSILNSPMLLGRDTDDLFYIDAVNGMLVKSAL